MKRILIVAAHPDDEVLGCGATIARLTNEGNEVYTLILGEGITSRYGQRDIKKRRKEISSLKKQIYAANNILGVKKIFVYNLPDNRFDTVPLLDIIKKIEKIKVKIKPDIIYTHSEEDLNIDHRITYNAVMTACRPVAGNSVKEIYSFEIPSSTDWGCGKQFVPDKYINIAQTFDRKIKALQVYKGEIREYPHPRSPEALKIIAKRWGIKVGINMAEPFKTIRNLKI